MTPSFLMPGIRDLKLEVRVAVACRYRMLPRVGSPFTRIVGRPLRPFPIVHAGPRAEGGRGLRRLGRTS
jgi:hypothetical protein